MNEIIEHQPSSHQVAPNPFGRMMASSSGMNAAVVEIESQRAIAEAQGKQLLARKFPRSMAQAHVDFMEACKIPEFAAVAFYAVPNRGSGPSIRFAEEAARCYGNFEFGHRELSRDNGRSVIEVYAWDTEKGNHSVRQLTVEHVVDTKNGPKVLRDQADIDNRIANVASKQMRGRILALLPKGLVMAGQAECRKTLAGDNDKPVAQRVRDMTGAFARFGVTIQHLEEYLQHSVDGTTLDELVDLTGVYNAIRDGAKAGDYFSLKDDKKDDEGQALTIAAKQRAAAVAPPPPAQPATTTKKPTAAEKTRTQAATQQERPAAPPAQQEPTQQEAPPPADQQQGGDPDDVF